MRYLFGDFELDTEMFLLSRVGQKVMLQPKVFDVLSYLIEHRERVVTKDELLDALWPGEHVNEAAIPWSINHARRGLDQSKGERKPIETVHGRGYRFVAEVSVRSTSSRPPESISAEPAQKAAAGLPFVGRGDVMRKLDAALDEATAGRGRLCLLVGEPGIGKTRCALEFAARARAQGVSTWSGRSAEGVGAPVFWPWVQILRDAVRERGALVPDIEALLARLSLVGMDGAPVAISDQSSAGPAQRFVLLEEISSLVLSAAQQAPAVLLLDDLQWADAGTIDLLSFLAPELPHCALLIVATIRDEPVELNQAALARLARHAERIDVAQLTTADIGLYVAHMTGGGEPGRELCQALYHATAGVPLFVQETVRALLAAHGAEALRTLSPDTIKPSELARDVLRGRLAELDQESRDLLASASVLGESFELSLLQQLMALDVDTLLNQLEIVGRAGFVVAEAPNRYRFSHALIRSIVYDDIKTSERVAAHRQAGELLEALPKTEPRESEIAQHFYRSLAAGDYARVTHTAIRAALAAARVHAVEDAVRFYEWALEAQALDPAVEARARVELLISVGVAQRAAGRDDDARKTLLRALESGPQHGYWDLVLRTTRALRPTHAISWIPDAPVRSALEQLLPHTTDGPDPLRISALSQLACVPPYSHNMKRCKELSARALELARELGNATSLDEAMRAGMYALSGPDDIDALLALTDEVLALDQDPPSSQRSLQRTEAYIARTGALLQRGDIAGADLAWAAFGSHSRALHMPEPVWFYDRVCVQRLLLDGDLAAAERGIEALRVRSKRMRLSYGEMFTNFQRMLLRTEREGLEPVSIGSNPLAYRTAIASLAPDMRARVIRTTAAFAPTQPLARSLLDEIAARDFRNFSKTLGYLNTLQVIGLAACMLDDKPRAEALYALLAPYPQHNAVDGMMFYEGSISHALAMLADCIGRTELVEGHFDDALAMNERMGVRSRVARTSLEYARWLHRQNRRPARAAELARKAQELADSIGMPWLSALARTYNQK